MANPKPMDIIIGSAEDMRTRNFNHGDRVRFNKTLFTVENDRLGILFFFKRELNDGQCVMCCNQSDFVPGKVVSLNG